MLGRRSNLPPREIASPPKTGARNDTNRASDSISLKERGGVLFIFNFISIAEAADDIRDVKPPVDLPPNYFYLYLLLAGLLLLGIVWLMRRLLKPQPKVIKKKPEAPPRPPWEIAYENLEKLRAERLIESGQIKEYYIRLSDIVRRYIEDRFSVHAPDMTTEEFLFSLKDHVALTDAQKSFLKDFMSHCDMIKFARHTATASEMQQSFDLAKRLVDETKVMTTRNNAK